MNNIFYFFILSFLLSFVLLKTSLQFLKRNFADIPNKRSSHFTMKPSGGGIIFLINTIFASFFSSNYFLLISSPLALMGLIDDKFNLPRKIRLFSHSLTALILVCSILLFKISLISALLFLPILVLIGVSIINFTNFMDGIDGLVGGCYLVIFVTATILVDKMYFPICGSLLAFLFLNWHPSKIFMGDVGSTFLGAIFFTVILQCKSIEEGLAFILISFPLMLDAFICVLRRLKSGKIIYHPHRDHLYQRLVDNNLSQSLVSLLYIFSTLFISLAYFFSGIIFQLFVAIVIFILAILIDKKFALKFNSAG